MAALASAIPTTAELQSRPTVIVVVGMAGSGKTTFLTRLYRHLSVDKARSSEHTKRVPPQAKTTEAGHLGGYYINLDPACSAMPFPPQLDIRDTVSYKDVMSTYQLGPNGAIMTSLNLFTTKFDQVLSILEARATASPDLEYIIIDTPGQIESFTWSASGQIITTGIASSFPTVLTFVTDTPRSLSPQTFMSNMLYACSIYYRLRLPLLVAFNKIDITDWTFAKEWMSDYEKFADALDNMERDESAGYYASLTRSMSLTLDEFYTTLRRVGVSAATGDGVEAFFEEVDKCREEFFKDYLPDIEARRAEIGKKRQEEAVKKAAEDVEKLKLDIESTNAANGA